MLDRERCLSACALALSSSARVPESPVKFIRRVRGRVTWLLSTTNGEAETLRERSSAMKWYESMFDSLLEKGEAEP